jgi:peptide chain release factor 1
VDIEIKDDDIRIDVYRAGGAGGQHVNTTNSAVRVTHLPTGLTVAIQDERSQHKNKAKALSVLRARLFDAERRRVASAESNARKQLIGSGDRSERVRTYNFPQGRVTDHRVGVTEHGMDAVMNGEKLDSFIEALRLQHQADLLSTLD